MTMTHDALDLTVQGPETPPQPRYGNSGTPWSWPWFSLEMGPQTPPALILVPTSDIW